MTGLLCPECGSPQSTVLTTRTHSPGQRRRRVCPKGHRFTTLEVAVSEKPRRLPTLECRPAWHNDLNGWELSDFILDDYDPWPAIAGEVSA